MPSVMGLLEERERAARQRVEALQAELREAEAVWKRFVIARETVGEVLAEPRRGEAVPPIAMAGEESVQVPAAVSGSVVPHWRKGLPQLFWRRTASGSWMPWPVEAERAGRRWTAGNSRRHSGWNRSRLRSKGCGRRRSAWPHEAGWRRNVRGCSACPSPEPAAHDHAHRPTDHRLRGVDARLVVAGQPT